MIYIHATGDFPFGRCTKREKKRKKQSVKKKKKMWMWATGEELCTGNWTSCPPHADLHFTYCTVCRYTKRAPGSLQEKQAPSYAGSEISPPGYSLLHRIMEATPPPSPERTIHTWAVVHTSRIHSPAPRQTQIDTHADGRTHTRTDAAGRKKTNTHRGLVS